MDAEVADERLTTAIAPAIPTMPPPAATAVEFTVSVLSASTSVKPEALVVDASIWARVVWPIRPTAIPPPPPTAPAPRTPSLGVTVTPELARTVRLPSESTVEPSVM